MRVSASRIVSEEVLRTITQNKEWVRNYQVKLNLVQNPRCPFPLAARLVPYLRESELKVVAKSKNVTAPIAQAAKQQLHRKAKPGLGDRDAPDLARRPRRVRQGSDDVVTSSAVPID